MNHPGVATIYHIGRFREMPYFAMELIAGTDLEVRISDGPMRQEEVIGVGIEVSRALCEAHRRGLALSAAREQVRRGATREIS